MTTSSSGIQTAVTTSSSRIQTAVTEDTERGASNHLHRLMIRNYLVVALRNISRFRLYAGVNIVGLAVGLACFILAFLYVEFELGFDRFHDDAGSIYRVVQRQPGNVFLGSDRFAVTPAPTGQAAVREIPEVVSSTTLTSHRALIQIGDRTFYERGLRVDDGFFDVFSFRLVDGSPTDVLSEPRSIVLTESLSEKLFPDAEALGKQIPIENEGEYTITGIVGDPPAQSHLHFAFVTTLGSYERYQEALTEGWDNNSWFTYLRAHPNADPALIDSKVAGLASRHLEGTGSVAEFYVQPLTDIYLRSQINMEISQNGNIRYVYLFAGIAIVILILAGINYTNLAVARSLKRAREVGMRKTVGAGRGQIAIQFLSESVLLASLALVLSIGLVYLALPSVGHYLDRPLEFDLASHPWMLPVLGALVGVVGLLSGFYPAVLMSSLRPADVLKGKLSRGVGKSYVQRVLVGTQYAASIGLVAVSFVIYQQLRFVQSADVGYQREQVLTVPMPDLAAMRAADVFVQETSDHPAILAVTTSGHLPTNVTSSTSLDEWEGREGEGEVLMYQTDIGYDFLDVFGMQLVEGRQPNPQTAADSSGGYLINETAKKALGWEAAVGRRIKSDGHVIGVVRDFHLHSLHQPIQPLMLSVDPDMARFVSMRVNDVESAVEAAGEAFAKISRHPFEYQFLDDAYEELYGAELRLGALLGYLTGLALLIASLGLFGLAAFAAEQRTKEIGVRKVLGASMGQIVMLLGKEFTILVVVAGAVALPIAYVAVERWLANFAYHVDVGVPTFALSVAAALFAAWFSVSYQSVRAARVNPAATLRME